MSAPVEVGKHEDVEQLGAGSGAEGVERLPKSALQFIRTHQDRALRVLPGALLRRECRCSFEAITAPHDPATSRHLGQCEDVSKTDPAMLKVLLKVKPGMDEDCSWAECGACGAGRRVPHFESIE